VTNRKRRILIVDDEAEARQLLKMALRAEDIEVIEASDGLAGLRLAYEMRPDLIMLDVAMPFMDGWLTCQRIREVWDTPVIMVTASSELPSRVKGLGLGADDFVAKPFDVDELQLRVRAVMRRAEERPFLERPVRYSDDHLTVDLATREVVVDGAPVELTPTEFGLLRHLIQHPNQPIGSTELLRSVWGDSYKDAEATLRVHLHHLRRKIEPDPRHPRYIRTERGVGYRFHAASSGG
jgi:two-component system, OmpR family, KDP operon response regulator KdpE